MSSSFAIAAYSSLLAAAAAPLALLLWRPAVTVPVVALYGALLLGLSGYQTGLFQGGTVPALDGLVSRQDAMSPQQCSEVIVLLERAGVIIERRSPPRLTVSQGRWEQLPQEGRDAVVVCVQRSWPDGAGAVQVDLRPE